MKTVLRRRREGKTDYRARLNLIKSGLPRFVVRKFLKNILIQIVEYGENGDRIITSAYSRELAKKFGWKTSRGNTSAAYLSGLLAGVKAKKKNIKNLMLDAGLHKITKGSVIFAAVKGGIDAGLNIPCSKDMFPSEDRIKGKNLKTKAEIDEFKEKILKS